LGPVSDASDDYSESLIFHTINSTALPLESEHALKLILGQRAVDNMTPEREFAYSPDLHFTRLLRDGLLKLPEPAQARLGNRPLTSLRAAVRGLLEMDRSVAKDLPTLQNYSKALLAALDDIATRLEPSLPSLCNAEFFIELAARLWKATPEGETHSARVNATVARLEQLAVWLGKDGLVDLKEGQSLCKQVVDIFTAVRSRMPKRVFLARWYPTADDGEELKAADLRLKGVKQAIAEVEKTERTHLELVDMGTQTGATFPIHAKMYAEIDSADIVLVDLTGVRPNVCVEAGFALRNLEKKRLIFIFQPTKAHEKVPFDLNTFRYEPFKDTGEIPDKIKPHIVAILKEAAVGS
jgi:nucleoside 2-deoxyribosyltransferase